jgi:hypothetical protein
MPAVLKPDMKALVWLGIGFVVLPYAVKAVRR